MEFTIERGKLYMLQTRNGKRTPQAGIKIAVALVNEGLCTKQEALLKIEPRSLDALLHPGFDKKALAAAKPCHRSARFPRRCLRCCVLHRRGCREALQGRPRAAGKSRDFT